MTKLQKQQKYNQLLADIQHLVATENDRLMQRAATLQQIRARLYQLQHQQTHAAYVEQHRLAAIEARLQFAATAEYQHARGEYAER